MGVIFSIIHKSIAIYHRVMDKKCNGEGELLLEFPEVFFHCKETRDKEE